MSVSGQCHAEVNEAHSVLGVERESSSTRCSLSCAHQRGRGLVLFPRPWAEALALGSHGAGSASKAPAKEKTVVGRGSKITTAMPERAEKEGKKLSPRAWQELGT